MPNGDILSQLAPQEPLGAAPAPQPGPPPPDGGGGFMDILGQIGGGLQQASPMILASVIGQTMGPEAMGSFLAGITSGQIQRQQLALQQQNQERQFGLQERRIDLEEARLVEGQQARTATLERETQEQDIKIVEDAIEERLGQAQQMIENGHPAAADDIRKSMKGFLQTMVTNHPGAASRYSSEEIELRFPKSLIETAYEEERRTAVERFFKNHEDYYQNLLATGGPQAVQQDLANLPPFDLGDGDPVPALDLIKKYGAEFGFAAGPGGDLSIRLPEQERETVTVQEDVPGAPPGTRRTRIIPKPGGEIPEEGVVVGGQRTPRPQQSMIGSLFPPTVRRETEAGAEELLTIDRETGQPTGKGIQTKPPAVIPPPTLSDFIRYRMAHPEYKGKFQDQFVPDVESGRIRLK